MCWSQRTSYIENLQLNPIIIARSSCMHSFFSSSMYEFYKFEKRGILTDLDQVVDKDFCFFSLALWII